MQVKMSPGKSAIILLILFGSTQTSQDLRRYASYRDDDRSMMTSMSRSRNGDAILSCDRSGTRCALENHSRIMERKPDSRRHEFDSRRDHFAIRSDDVTSKKRDILEHNTRYRMSDRERVFNDRRVLNDNRNRIENLDTEARSDRSRERLKVDGARVSDRQARNRIDAERVLQDRRIDQRRNDMDRRTIPESSERRMVDRTFSRNSLSEKYATIRDSYRKPFRENQRQISRQNTRSNDVSLSYHTDAARRSATPDIREDRDAQRTSNRYRSAFGRSNEAVDTGASSVDSLKFRNIDAERTSALESRNRRDTHHFKNNAQRRDDPITNKREVTVRDSSTISVDSGMVRDRRYIVVERHETRTSTLESKTRRDLHFSRNNGQRRDAPITSEREDRIRVSSPGKIHEKMNEQLSSRARLTRESNDELLQPERRDTLQKSRRFRDSDVTHWRSARSSRRDLREDIRIFEKSVSLQRTPSTVQTNSHSRDYTSDQERSFIGNNRIPSSRDSREREISERRSISSLRRDLREDIRSSKNSENLQRTSRFSLERRIREVITPTVQSYSRGRDDRSLQETSFIENSRIRSSRNSLETDISQRRSILSSRRQDVRISKNIENEQRTTKLSLERRVREVIPSTVQSYSHGRSHQETSLIENNRIRSSRNSRETDISHRRYTLSSRRNLREDIRSLENSENVQRTSRLSLERRVRKMIPSTAESYSRDKDSRSNQDNSFVRKMEEMKDGQMIRFTDRMIGTKAHAQNRFLKERTIIEPPEMGHSEQNKFTLAWLNTLQIILGLYLIGEMFGASKKTQKGFFQIHQMGLNVRREKVN